MSERIKDLISIPVIPPRLFEAIEEGNHLAFFVGAGVSKIAGMPGWAEWTHQVLSKLRKSKRVGFNYSDFEEISCLAPKKQLSIAKEIARESPLKKINYKTSLKARKKHKQHPIYQTLNKFGCTFVTTNYDLLLEPVSKSDDDRIDVKEQLTKDALNKIGRVIHLHGSIRNSDDMIISTRQYFKHYTDPNIIELLDKLFADYTVVFIGYGLEEADILEQIIKKNRVASGIKNFILDGFFSNQIKSADFLAKYYESIGMQLIPFNRDKNNYAQLIDILENWRQQLFPQHLLSDLQILDEVLENE